MLAWHWSILTWHWSMLMWYKSRLTWLWSLLNACTRNLYNAFIIDHFPQAHTSRGMGQKQPRFSHEFLRESWKRKRRWEGEMRSGKEAVKMRWRDEERKRRCKDEKMRRRDAEQKRRWEDEKTRWGAEGKMRRWEDEVSSGREDEGMRRRDKEWKGRW